MNSAVRILIAFCLLILPFTLRAQYRFDYWTSDDGLPQNSVGSMAQTADGYIWLATLDGLARFDGVRFTVFNKSNSKNLPSNRLINMIADGNTLWVITEENDLTRYLENSKFQTFTEADGLPSADVFWVMKDADANVLAYTDKGIARFDGERFTVIRGGNDFEIDSFRVYYAPSGTYWEMNGNSLTALQNGKKTEYALPVRLNELVNSENFSNAYLVRMFETRSGELFITVGLHIFRLQDGVIKEMKAEETPKAEITDIAEKIEGDIWFGTIGKGACRYFQNRFECFDTKDGLPSNNVKDILLDREGSLWISTNEKGFCRLSEQIITPVSATQGLAGTNVYSVLENAEGTVWIGSFGSISKFQNGKMTNYGLADGLIYQFVQSLFEDRNGTLWVGSLEGVQYFKDGKFFDFMKPLDSKGFGFGVFDIHRDRQGVLWLATSSGLIKYEGSSFKNLTVSDGLPGNNIKAILESRSGETLWIGTQNGLAEIKNGQIRSFTDQDGLAGNHIRSLYEEENGTLWIGTYDSGLSRFVDGKFTNYKKTNGLSSDGAFQILPDDQNNFWMSSNQGIYRVSRAELEEFAEGRRQVITSTVYGKSDGMLNSEANGGGQPAGTRTKDGRLWFPTQDGVAVIDPASVKVNPLPPPVVIEKIRKDNIEQFDIPNPKSRIEMQPGEENLEIDYTGLSFIKPEQVRFRYKLEGLEDDWTEAGTRRTAFYPHLAPGEYTFRVIAANSDNVWNEEGTTLSIRVIPPFYQTWWFYAACLAIFGVMIYAIYRHRVHKLELARVMQEEFSRRLINAHETERRRIAAELHDSIGQSLAMIKNRAIFGAKDAEGAMSREQFDQITRQTTQTIGEVREISYNLRPYLLENLGLTKAIESLVDKIEEVHLLEIDAQIDDIDGIFSAEDEMSVYRVIQESLNNVVKHSETDEAVLRIEKSDGFVTIKIEDEGRGFDKNAAPKADAGKGGFGLLGIKERVRMLGGTLKIDSKIGSGTRLTIRIETTGKT